VYPGPNVLKGGSTHVLPASISPSCSHRGDMKLRALRAKLSRNGSTTRASVGQTLSRVILNHHVEVDRLLELIYNAGEVADLGPLKGAVSIIRALLHTAKVCCIMWDNSYYAELPCSPLKISLRPFSNS
jgi:hypothetical protein